VNPSAEAGEDSYTRAVGACLRRTRQRLGLSLHEVEARSDQEFKASVLSAYERGERAISVPRLQRLAALYGVPIEALLPRLQGLVDPQGVDANQELPRDLDHRLDEMSEADREIVLRFVRTIRSQRRGEHGPTTPSIRADDVRAIELLLGSSGAASADRDVDPRGSPQRNDGTSMN